MKTTAKDPHTRLTERLELAPRLVGSGTAVELMAAGVVVLLDGAATDLLAPALFDLWTDFGSGEHLQACVTLAASMRSLELWRSIPARGRVDRHVVDALERMFAPIHANPARLREALPPDAEDALVEGLLSHVEAWRAPPLDSNVPSVREHAELALLEHELRDASAETFTDAWHRYRDHQTLGHAVRYRLATHPETPAEILQEIALAADPTGEAARQRRRSSCGR